MAKIEINPDVVKKVTGAAAISAMFGGLLVWLKKL